MVVIMFLYFSINDYLGFCGNDYDVRYSISERQDFAVEYYLKKQYLYDYYEIRDYEEDLGSIIDSEEFRKNYKLIEYKGKDDFYKTNPECCSLGSGGLEGRQFGFWERINGIHGVFNIEHKIRYYDNHGEYKEIVSKNSYFSVNNCGGSSHGSF
jgi:hypothetical protein